MALFPLWGRKKIKEPLNIGKITIVVNQVKKFVVNTRYAWTRQTCTQTSLSTGLSVKKSNGFK